MATVYSLALKTTINEIRNISPEIYCAFIFKPDQVIAYDDNANPETIQSALQVFNEMTSRIDSVGGLDSMAIQGSDGRLNFMQCINGYYLATVSSKLINEKTLFMLNRILVPSVIKIVIELTQKGEAPVEIEESPPELDVPKQEQPVEVVKSEPVEIQEQESLELILTKPPVHQFMAEKATGLLQSDAVRIDGDVVDGWNKLFEGKVIDHIIIETLRFKIVRCKFKPIKESKVSSKGLVQLPEKVMQALEVNRGDLVMVKPIIENQRRS